MLSKQNTTKEYWKDYWKKGRFILLSYSIYNSSAVDSVTQTTNQQNIFILKECKQCFSTMVKTNRATVHGRERKREKIAVATAATFGLVAPRTVKGSPRLSRYWSFPFFFFLSFSKKGERKKRRRRRRRLFPLVNSIQRAEASLKRRKKEKRTCC